MERLVNINGVAAVIVGKCNTAFNQQHAALNIAGVQAAWAFQCIGGVDKHQFGTEGAPQA